jgi:hypothetical protein
MGKNSAKYLQSMSFSQFMLAEKIGNKNLGHATPDLIISQSSSSSIQI